MEIKLLKMYINLLLLPLFVSSFSIICFANKDNAVQGLRQLEQNSVVKNVYSRNLSPQNLSVDYSKFKKELNQYLNKYQGRYGIYYYDIKTGNEFGINEAKVFTAASTIKLPLNLYLYNRIKSGFVNGNSFLTYLKQDYEEGTGRLQFNKIGTKYSIRNLSRLSITASDNVAANILTRYLGKQNVKNFMREVEGKAVDDIRNKSSPKDMGLYTKLLYDFYQKNGDLGKELMNSFLNTEFKDRIPAKLPKNIKVAHKIGNQINVIHDVGIVFTDNPYIICVMSSGVNEDIAPRVIANISRKIYDFRVSW